MSNNKSNLLWIDDKLEKQFYIQELESLNKFNIYTFRNIDDIINKLKEIKFEKTFIIINNNYYNYFITQFIENIKDIFVIPKIIIIQNPIEKNTIIHNSKEDPFYNICFVKNNFSEIKEFFKEKVLLNKEEKLIVESENEEKQFIFENIDKTEKLYFPLYYRMLINVNSLDNFDNTTKYIYNQYSNNNQIFYLFSQIIDLKSIPIELLCKYYVRIYTLNSNFNQDINKHLLEGKLNIFENYIKILYEGIKLEILKTPEEKYLYHLTKFNNKEIIKIKNNLENKKDNLPLILFSKQFLSFLKKKKKLKNI